MFLVSLGGGSPFLISGWGVFGFFSGKGGGKFPRRVKKRGKKIPI